MTNTVNLLKANNNVVSHDVKPKDEKQEKKIVLITASILTSGFLSSLSIGLSIGLGLTISPLAFTGLAGLAITGPVGVIALRSFPDKKEAPPQSAPVSTAALTETPATIAPIDIPRQPTKDQLVADLEEQYGQIEKQRERLQQKLQALTDLLKESTDEHRQIREETGSLEKQLSQTVEQLKKHVDRAEELTCQLNGLKHKAAELTPALEEYARIKQSKKDAQGRIAVREKVAQYHKISERIEYISQALRCELEEQEKQKSLIKKIGIDLRAKPEELEKVGKRIEKTLANIEKLEGAKIEGAPDVVGDSDVYSEGEIEKCGQRLLAIALEIDKVLHSK